MGELSLNPERLETERLILRKARADDLDAILKNVWSDDALAANMLWQPTRDREAAAARLKRTMRVHADLPVYFVCLKANDEPVGLAGVRPAGRNVFEECGICVAVRLQRQGYGREILGALVELVFEPLRGAKFLYSCFHENTASERLCRSFGFRYAFSDEITREWDGRRFRRDAYALTREVWLNYNKKDPAIKAAGSCRSADRI